MMMWGSSQAVTLGGAFNVHKGSRGVLGGGSYNTLGSGGSDGALLGGTFNTVNGTGSAIIGGWTGTVDGSAYSALIGGQANIVNNNSSHSVVLGGMNNTITNTSSNTGILGGTDNLLTGSSKSVIIGGASNTLNNSPECITIGGYGSSQVDGFQNALLIASNASIMGSKSSIISGYGNYLQGTNSTILGGYSNGVTGNAQNCGIMAGGSNVIQGSTGGSSSSMSAILASTSNLGMSMYSSAIIGSGWCEANTTNLSIMAATYGSKLLGNVDTGSSVSYSAVLGGSNHILQESSNTAHLGGSYNTSFLASNSVVLGGQYGVALRDSEVVTGAGLFYGTTGFAGEAQKSSLVMKALVPAGATGQLSLPDSKLIVMAPYSTIAMDIDLVSSIDGATESGSDSAYWSFKVLAKAGSTGCSMVVNNRTYNGGDLVFTSTDAFAGTTGLALMLSAAGQTGSVTKWMASIDATQVKSAG
jgi:hypothetical protein